MSRHGAPQYRRIPQGCRSWTGILGATISLSTRTGVNSFYTGCFRAEQFRSSSFKVQRSGLIVRVFNGQKLLLATSPREESLGDGFPCCHSSTGNNHDKINLAFIQQLLDCRPKSISRGDWVCHWPSSLLSANIGRFLSWPHLAQFSEKIFDPTAIIRPSSSARFVHLGQN